MRPGLLTCLVLLVVLGPSLPIVLLGDYLVLNSAVATIHFRGVGMSPAIHDDDYLVAEKLPYRLLSPGRGDIVLFRDPADASRDLVKRVVGLPGERVLVRDCRVFIDGRPLAERYVATGSWTLCAPAWPSSGAPRTLGPDDLFVMGDNRDRSTDSRTLGPIARGQVEARVRFRVLPLARYGVVF